MRTQVQIVAVLHIVFGIIGILIGLAALVFLGGLAGIVGVAADADDAVVAAPILGFLGALAFGVMLLLSVPGVIGGFGLLKFRPWARVLMIAISALELIHVPIGTVLGIYGLYVLLSNETVALFEPQARAASVQPYMK